MFANDLELTKRFLACARTYRPETLYGQEMPLINKLSVQKISTFYTAQKESRIHISVVCKILTDALRIAPHPPHPSSVLPVVV